MQLGVIDDIALLSETDIRNKEQIVKRKSMYAQLQEQIQQLSEAAKDKDGTIETLERQLVQAGIKGKVMQAEMEITKKKEEAKNSIDDEVKDVQTEGKLLTKSQGLNQEAQNKEAGRVIQNYQKDLQNRSKDS